MIHKTFKDKILKFDFKEGCDVRTHVRGQAKHDVQWALNPVFRREPFSVRSGNIV